MEAYGKKMALKHLADLSANPDGSFTVSPWDGSTADAICEQLSSRPELGMSGTSTVGAGEEPVVLLIPRENAEFEAQTLHLQAAVKNIDKSAVNKSDRRQAKMSIQEVVDTMPWNALPTSAQELYARLGWSEAEWENDSASNVVTEGLAWDDLGAEQQAAAATLGYKANTWNSWTDLSETDKVQWSTLGWTSEDWDNDIDTASEGLSWADLSVEEQEAATKLGYAQENWDSWDDLSEESRAAWSVLGWKSTNWDDGSETATERLQWAELSDEQQAAAVQLGYLQDTWDSVM
jgi:hypothetical protein